MNDSPCIVINRQQPHTQSPAAYIGYFADGEEIDRATGVGGFRGGFPVGGSQKVISAPMRVVYQQRDLDISNWNGKLIALNGLKSGWNGYDAPPPSQPAILLAYDFVNTLVREEIEPTRLAPSVVGGIGVTRRKAERKVYVEFFNDGSVFAMFSDGSSEPTVRKIEPGHQDFKQLASAMREYLDG